VGFDLSTPVVAAPDYVGHAVVKGWEIAMPSLAQLIVWIVMGLVGGSLAGPIITRERKGFGLVRNMGLGLAGAIVGGLLFRLLGLLPGLDQISISLRDVVAAFVGSLIVLAAIWLWQRFVRS
jgi:uncharacterized membrane protein YeaQ/YmgE (transglycosylase-associated protein family)